MKLSPPNLLLLASCFGIAFEFRKMINNTGPMIMEHGETSIKMQEGKRKDWLKSDRRKQMEEVAIKQGWVQYVDAATKKRFWHCPFTDESFFELVFVGTESVTLNRWCSPDESGAQIHKSIDHGYIPPPVSRDSPIPRTLSLKDESEIQNTKGDGEFQNNENIESIHESMQEIITNEFNNYEEPVEKKESFLGKPKPVKGRHTKGRKTKKVPSRLLKLAEQKRAPPIADQDTDDQEVLDKVEEEVLIESMDNATTEEEEEEEGSMRRSLRMARRRSRPRNGFALANASMLEDPSTEFEETGYQKPKLGAFKQGRRAHNNGTVSNISSSSSLDSFMTTGSPQRPSSKERRYPFFMHLHKSAGTTLCELALRNKLRAAGLEGDKAVSLSC